MGSGVRQIGKFKTPNERQIINFKRVLPYKIANIVKIHFIAGFRKGGGQTNKSLSGWKALSEKYAARKRKDSRPTSININSGDLMGDIDKRHTNFGNIVVGTSTDVPYAEHVNDEREFIGKSTVLEKKVKLQIETEINKIFL